MLVAIVTGMLLFSVANAAGQQALTSPPSVPAGLGQLLSRPLPGTPERVDADAARALEAALCGFTGVASARVIIARTPSDGSDDHAVTPRRLVAIQLGIADDFSPTPAWVEGLVTFVLRSLPDLDAADLTIIDADAAVLYEGGHARVSSPAPQASSQGRAMVTSLTRAHRLVAACVVGGVLMMLVLVIGRRRLRVERTPAPALGPLAFLEELSVEQLRRVLAGERPELIALVAAQLAPRAARRVREAAGLPLAPLERPELVTPEVVATVARALREKLVRP